MIDMTELPTTNFCYPHRCICREIADKDRIILCVSDPSNAAMEQRDHDRLVLKYDRLMDAQQRHQEPDETSPVESVGGCAICHSVILPGEPVYCGKCARSFEPNVDDRLIDPGD